MAVEELINRIIDNKNNKMGTIIIYLDFSKAYSTVNHKVLIDKLITLNVPTKICKWINNFLNSIVLLMNCKDGCTKRRVSEGILQGSVISPVLFNIYTNDIHNLQEDDVRVIQYADDFCIIFAVEDPSSIQEQIQNKMNQFTKLFKKLNLNINPSKTKMQYFPQTNRMEKMLEIDITMGTTTNKIKSEEVNKYLGILIDNRLNFIAHTKSIQSKLEKRLTSMKYLMYKKNSSHPLTNINIGKSLILPVIYYGSSLWMAGRKTNRDKMDVLINNMIRQCTGTLKSTKIIFLRGLTNIYYATDKSEELALRRIAKFNIEERSNYENYVNKFKVEKLYLRKIAIKYRQQGIQNCIVKLINDNNEDIQRNFDRYIKNSN